MSVSFPEYFFDLQNFPHKEFFLLEEPVWETLKHLKESLEKSCLGEIMCDIPNGVTLVNKESITIGKGTRIEPGAYIEGPCLIGENCEIRHGAYLRPFVLMGNHCVVGHSSEVKHAIFLNGAQAPHFNYVGDSILGNHVNLGAGVICANFRLDHGEVCVDVEGDRLKTGMRKFGAILGDGSQIGCNSVLNPGVLLKKRTFSRACSSIQKSNIRKNRNVNCSENLLS
ncbi:MAG: UDP-N-acetylglucosamine diphosphorylase [Chlamydiia bacterium]|nr:UDP-N-acetylglucosamine diphosphorylase [Chlamydiia bacterium]